MTILADSTIPELSRREKIRAAQKLRWADPAYRASRSGHKRSPEVCAKISAGQKKLWEEMTDEERQQRSSAMTEAASSPEAIKKKSEATTRQMAKPGAREAIAEHTTQQWKRMRDRMIVGIRSAPASEAKSKNMMARWADDDERRALESAINAAMTPEVIKKRAESFRAYLKTPEGREQWSEIGNKTWADEEIAKRRTDGMRKFREEQKQKLADAERVPTLQEQIAKLQENLRLLEVIKQFKPNDQTVARLLIDNPKLRNEEIGCIFDERRVSCPYGHSWQRELKRDNGAKWISTLRTRLRRLGLLA